MSSTAPPTQTTTPSVTTEPSSSAPPNPKPKPIPSQSSLGNASTHWTGPNTYLLSQLQRANYITARRTPFAETSDSLASALQRLVHHEGNRPPNRKILLHLRLLTYYPPNPLLDADLVLLLESENQYVARLAHYHIRQAAPIPDPGVYRDLMEALEREVLRPSPARRAAATKTLAKVFHLSDVARSTDFIMDVFNSIGGARVEQSAGPARRTIAGVEVPGTDRNRKKVARREKMDNSRLGQLNAQLFSKKVVAGQTRDVEKEEQERRVKHIDDGAGGTIESATGNAVFIKSRFGKMLVGHSVLAAMRRVNRVATRTAKVESYLFDSGFLSIVSSTVRHCIALVELRSTVAPGPVSRYLAPRLPHRNPPATKRLHLEELGARVYFARLCSALAEDPNLSAFIPDDAPKQARRDTKSSTLTFKQALAGPTTKEKASNLFKFLFNKERVADVMGAVKVTADSIVQPRKPLLKRDDPLGVEFAEALINLLKNASNRVLIEALRGLSKRRWTTWFEAPIAQGALYNAPELKDAEAYGGAAAAWGIDEDDEDDDFDGEDEDELGAYEDDVVGEDQNVPNAELPDQEEIGPQAQKDTWFSRLNLQRQERRTKRTGKNAPFYLRTVGQGMVPALEVILRRVNGGLLEDEPVRRFAAADAIIVLARAKIYGHTQAEHQLLRKAQSNVRSAYRASSSRALVTAFSGGDPSVIASGGSEFSEEKHPFEGLVRPLAELVDEDPNQFVRGRAAVALLFIIGAGAGRNLPEADASDAGVSQEVLSRNAKLQSVPLLLRYFKGFVIHEGAGSGVGLRLMSEVIDYLVYEVLDVAPELAPSAIDMAETWALTHPTVGVCGRLGSLWEKVLSIGQGEVVGKSIFRAVTSQPRTERVASAAVIFLRRRTLDIAILTVGASQIPGNALPDPLPRSVGVEMEKFFSLLWHAALLGPSAECRTFAVEALGGAAALAGEPFRCCAYERLVELVRLRGFGLKIPAERVLDSLDMLYFSRERFSEARAKNGIARDGSNKSKVWLELVWRLAAEASSAIQILLGVPPPTGWQPLGPGGAADLKNAEDRFGDVRDRQEDGKLKDASVITSSAPDVAPILAIEDVHRSPEAGASSSQYGRVPAEHLRPGTSENEPNMSRDVALWRSRSRSPSPAGSDENYYARSSRRDRYETDDYEDYDRYSGRREEDRYREGHGEEYGEEYRGEKESPVSRRVEDGRGSNGEVYGGASGSNGLDATEAGARKKQEEADHELAMRYQAEINGKAAERGSSGQNGRAGGKGSVSTDVSAAAEKLLKKGLQGGKELTNMGKELTNKAMQAAVKRGAGDKIRGLGGSSSNSRNR